MPPLQGFVGPAYVLKSPTVATSRLVNFYLEPVLGEEKNAWALLPTPGLATFCESGYLGGVRCLWEQAGRAFAVMADQFGELYADGTFFSFGSVGNDGQPATISANVGATFLNPTNPQQLFITSAGKGYTFDMLASVLTLIADPDFDTPTVMGVGRDTYVFSLTGPGFQFSALNNASAWDGIDVAQPSEDATTLLAFAWLGRVFWLLGGTTSELWFDTGDSDNPFLPIPGTFVEKGIAAPWSLAKVGEVLCWLQRDRQGAGVVVKTSGQNAEAISTLAVSAAIQSYDVVDDAIGWGMQFDGHWWYVLTFPTQDTTWVFDLTTQQWFEWLGWNDEIGTFTAHPGACHCFAFGLHLVGDLRTGTVYSCSNDHYDNAGTLIRRMRRCPHLTKDQRVVVINRARLELQTGNGTIDVPLPTVMWRISTDAGRTWTDLPDLSSGAVGEYDPPYVEHLQLGGGLDWVHEVTVVDAVPWVFTNLYLDATLGLP